MAKTLKEIMEDDIEAVEQDTLYASVVYGGATITGTVSPIDRTDDVAPEGIFDERDLEFVGRRTLFTGGIPDVRDTVTMTCSDLSIDSVKFYVDTKTEDAAGISLRLRRI